MINIELNILKIADKTEPILRWEVWFNTPTGLFDNREDALEDIAQNDFPSIVIEPVPVAISETLYEVKK